MDSKQVYEIGFHIMPTVSEEKIGDEVAIIRSAIEKAEGMIVSESFPQMKPLAYSMEKHIDTKKVRFDKAYFGWVKFEMSPDLISEVKGVADTHQNILRYLIIKTVRENTMREVKERITEEKKEKGEVSEEELNKSIEELVIE